MEHLKLSKTIKRIKNGHVKSFEKIVDAYEKQIFGFIYSIVKDQQHAEDLTQEVFIKIYRNLHNFDEAKSFSTWILTIARNAAYDHVRKHSREVTTDTLEMGVRKSPECDYIERAFNEHIDAYVQMLSEPYRTLIYLKYFEELSYQEMGLRLGVEPSTVKWQLYDARKKLLKMMDKKEVKSWIVE